MKEDRLSTILEQLLSDPTPREHGSLAEWKRDYPALGREHPDPVTQAIVGGFRANCMGYAFMAGYQAALRALEPQLPPDALCALCVTEAEGNHPRAIRTTLTAADHGFRLSGAKTFVTGGALADCLLVAARSGERDGRPEIRMVRIHGDAPGMSRRSTPPIRFVPEVDHASVQFDDIAVKRDALLPGDGYRDYVKPFRTVEDCHVSLAVAAYLLRISLAVGAPPSLVEESLACIAAHAGLATLDPASAATHLVLAGARGLFHRFIPALEERWRKSDPASFTGWERDRPLLEVAASARERRLALARERLPVPRTA
jgi:hypothetical protein